MSSCPPPLELTPSGRSCVAPPGKVELDGGVLRVGASDWEAFDRIVPRTVLVAPFALDRFEVTEARWTECVDRGACPARTLSGEGGRAMGALTPQELRGYCEALGGRLPTDDEWTWAASGKRMLRYPWGDTGAVCRRAAWGLVAGPCGTDARFPSWSGTHPDGRSAEGIHDLAGNVAEWVETASGETALRGGSFHDGLATSLRGWHSRPARPDERLPDAGGRCAYTLKTPVAREGQ